MKSKDKLGLWMLVLVSIGSMIGGGIFNSPTDLIKVANPQAVIISWIIGGLGVVSLAYVFQLLCNKRPELTGGIFTYAKEGFGEFAGFNSAWGYWVSAWVGNVAFSILLFKTLEDLIGKINPLNCFIMASLLIWTIYFIQIKGIKNIGIINGVITVGKLIPIVLVIILGFMAFKINIFNVPNWIDIIASKKSSLAANTSLFGQIKASMGTILWCFVGIEAASVLSERAKSRKIVGKAIMISLGITLLIYMFISIISMGTVPAVELSKSTTPFADILSTTIIGKNGAIIAKMGLIVSLLGASISWSMLAAETPYVTGKEKIMPAWFGKVNGNGAPVNSLFITTLCTQLFLLSLLSGTLQKAYYMIYNIATTTILIPYLFSALYALKISFIDKLGLKEKFIVIVASLYSLYVIYAVGLVYLGFAFILYSLGIGLYIYSKRQINEKLSLNEKYAMIIMAFISIGIISLIVAGKISI